ncbi:adenine-specific DNA-methyltransferase [Chryseobacterium sp. SORGH_AS 447]|uniref:site-specific DNA-methyltransferase n=1 Tax=Chryseobacterium sp. SORGH_AS_0447 TaxID=3041769 RepID=UPI002780F4A6|nr:site-specific DNA-methyltransferase [Chryseobacterium sp. SORGH_AS_0447]MDQ1161837.1 adenine-specific DNA-methyltransferase [Chryseobacterium sp. SORGH_AS_0447]
MNDKLDLQSTDITSLKIEKITALFPNCVTETAEGKKIDFDLLKQELSTEIVEGNKERYRLEWPGKREAIVTANIPTTKTLRPVREDSVDFDTTENIYIEGDNLEVLKLLQESYLNKIKMIYIDPPYNTGKDFVYKDNFAKAGEEELFESGQKDEYNQRLVANPETNGRYHSDWLSMMYPRLKLARNLLTEDGVIFISIDDNEVDNLKKIADEVFGEVNRLGVFQWRRRQTTDNRNESRVSFDHEYILAYSKTVFAKLKGRKIDESKYTNRDNDPRGVWASIDLSGLATANQRPNLHFDIIDPKTGNSYPPNPNRGWSKSKETIKKMIEEERILFPSKPGGRPREKKFLAALQSSVTGFSTWLDSKLTGFNTDGTREVTELMQGKFFDFPKPLALLSLLIEQCSYENNDIILDFFSGSATTAHAVMQLNAKDGENRKYIMVQLPEATDEKSEAYKAGYKNICEIGKERIRRAANKIKENTKKEILGLDLGESSIGWATIDGNKKIKSIGSKTLSEGSRDEISKNSTNIIEKEIIKNISLDLGFRVYRLDSSNMQDVYYKPQDYNQGTLDLFADNVKEGRTAEDLVTQVMLDWGLPLSLPIERKNISGKEVYAIAGDSLYCCFDDGIDEDFAKAIAQEKPLRIVFRDRGFKDDTAKENVKQLLKQLSVGTEMRVI